MRKKSHVSLAGYLVRGLGLEELRQHRKAFCLGSILPDLNPKILAAPHEYDTTFRVFQDLCRQMLSEVAEGEESERALWRKAGIAMHYLADYFTYPHNASFGGSLKDHCLYESSLKCHMRVLVWMPEGRAVFGAARESAAQIDSLAGLFAYITGMHRAYMRERDHTPESDSRWILAVCATALTALAVMVGDERQTETNVRYA